MISNKINKKRFQQTYENKKGGEIGLSNEREGGITRLKRGFLQGNFQGREGGSTLESRWKRSGNRGLNKLSKAELC